ncbi:MAG: methyltransferase domain-containing protein [Alphaproteobacteria bacterium]
MSQAESHNIFDRVLLRRRHKRFAPQFAAHDFLHREAAAGLLERRADIKRPLSRVLALGYGLEESGADVAASLAADVLPGGATARVVADEEFLPFAPRSFDLIVGNLNFHMVNDLPGALLQCRHILAPDGLLLAAMLGGETLHQLRHCLYEAEQAATGGVSPRVAPFAEAASMAGLLQRAGFILPVADREVIETRYPDILALMRELRGMGMGNTLHGRIRHPSRREIFARAAALYAERYPAPDGGVSASFEIIYLHGWNP